MQDISWNVFRHTGNIETYLLMKELEESTDEEDQ
ncbi:YqzL family protein [Salimicrobium halophilum]|nr:YqzL family protein [Salimicrobium halophilum]